EARPGRSPEILEPTTPMSTDPRPPRSRRRPAGVALGQPGGWRLHDRRAEVCVPAPENRTLSRVDLPADGCVSAGLAATAGVSTSRQARSRPARSLAGATNVSGACQVLGSGWR